MMNIILHKLIILLLVAPLFSSFYVRSFPRIVKGGLQVPRKLMDTEIPASGEAKIAKSVHFPNDSRETKQSLENVIKKRNLFDFSRKFLSFDFLWPDSIRMKLSLVMSMVLLYCGKRIGVQLPFLLQSAIDSLSKSQAAGSIGMQAIHGVSLTILLYGASRSLATILLELKTCLFNVLSQSILRKFSAQIFLRLHELDSNFHLTTPGGTISVAYLRAIRGFQMILFQMVFSALPALVELVLVSATMKSKFGSSFAAITLCTFMTYLVYTIAVTQYRVKLRKRLVDIENNRNAFLMDSLLNHETVKLFTNEAFESQQFDSFSKDIQDVSIASTTAIALLNIGQSLIFSCGLTVSLLTSLRRVQAGSMSVGDMVALNSLMLQLSIPFNFMGYTYQEMRQSIVDMAFMSNLLMAGKNESVGDQFYFLSAQATLPDLETVAPRGGAPSGIEFRNVAFNYQTAGASANLLKNVSFSITPGQHVAIVGPSGGGKSTVFRLLTQLLLPSMGSIIMDGVDISTVSAESVRRRVAVVPQDTSLFDNTVEYNIKYGNLNATEAEMNQVIEKCNLQPILDKMPEGLHTRVGERWARLSGGERQKVIIARALLKSPSILLCDEVTSSVDSFSERDLIESLQSAAGSRTTITVAHKLSSIMHCDSIIVLDNGEVAEQGTHSDLLRRGGVYKNLWDTQHAHTVPL